MDTNIATPPVTGKWHKRFAAFTSLSVSWLTVLLLMRIVEWILNGMAHTFPARPLSFLSFILTADLLFFCQSSMVLLILFIAASVISLKTARIVYIVCTVILSLGYFSLIRYFNSTLVLLGADIFSYSIKEIQQTVGASGDVNAWSIVSMLVVIALMPAAYFFAGRHIKAGAKTSYAFIGLLLTGWLVSSTTVRPEPAFSDEYENSLARNKFDYFLSASYSHFFPEASELDIYADAYIGDFGEISGAGTLVSFNYINEKKYPFLHADSTQDVLTPFFKPSATPPNIVIILVEGLGRAFTNENAYLGSFTPFLDSLSQHSLYWQNCLSGGGRTFAVLPSVIGSLPFGKNGFNEMGKTMPPHLSLMSLLKKNGYYTSFFYGGDAGFDNMKLFMQQQAADAVYDKSSFPAGYKQLPSNNGFAWGYGDKELFQHFLAKQAERNSNQPSLQVLLTVATHSPFAVNDQAVYNRAAEQRFSALNLSEEQQQEHRKYLMQYASILYADDALKDFFRQYSRRPDFKNTVFLITGDHRMPEIPMATKIDRYHVPLIMYSPMLQRTARFESMSSHVDIAPSLLAYLKNNFPVKAPSLVSWVGSGLDTARTFRNIHANAYMQTKTDLVDYVMGNYHLNGNDVFRMNNQLNEEKLADATTKENLQAAFGRFLQKNMQFTQGAPLLPDSILKAYHPNYRQ